MSSYYASVYTRPSKGTATERVWEIADEITRKNGRRARRKQVIDAYVAEGGNANTASTQYYYWSQKFDADNGAEKLPTRSSGQSFQLRIESSGRLVVPAELREAMELGPDGRVTARVVDGELRLVTPSVALRKLREMARKLVPDGRSMVDEFIAEKREEAARE
ncbi:MAG: hypothetical protein BroJett030_16110 [Alphaproteobacteria bacterium]|nr:MAG: hypothetical protein BroJett030_16110 [Alphaproteobacteria bacterium]